MSNRTGDLVASYVCPGGRVTTVTCQEGVWTGSAPVCDDTGPGRSKEEEGGVEVEPIAAITIRKIGNQKLSEPPIETETHRQTPLDMPGRSVNLDGHYFFSLFVSIIVYFVRI